MRPIIFLIIFVIIIGGAYFIFSRDNSEKLADSQNFSEEKNISQETPKNMNAIIKTNLGDIELELFTAETPIR